MAATTLTLRASIPSGRLDLDGDLQALDSVSGAKFFNDGNTVCIVKNGGAGPHTITVTTPKAVTDLGLAVADPTFVIVAGDYCMLPLFDKTYFNDSGGYVSFIASGTQTECTATAVKLGK